SAWATSKPWRLSARATSDATTSYVSTSVISGTCRSIRRRTIDITRSAGTVTNTIRKAPATPIVIGKPRAILSHLDSRAAGVGVRRAVVTVGGGPAIETPTRRATAAASTIHAVRTVHSGTHRGNGTNASTSAAMRGAATPISKIGQAAAAATR